MASTKRKTVAHAQAMAAALGGEFASSAYTNNRVVYDWKCGLGHSFTARYDDVRSKKSWCKTCTGRVSRTLADAQAIAAEKGGRCLALTFPNTQDKIPWQCAKEHVWEAAYYVIQAGHWCPDCAGCRKRTIEDLQKIAKERGGLSLAVNYKNAFDKLPWECKYGHKFSMIWNSVSNGQWCPECNGNNVITLDMLKEKAATRGGECLSTEYKTIMDKYRWICKKRHPIWEAAANNILNQDSWCPACTASGPSKGQIDLYNFIKSLEVDAYLDSKAVIHPKEIDVWVPSAGLAIEYNGLYWHSDAVPGYYNGREAEKAALVHGAGHKFLMIYEDEWEQKRALIEAMIRQRLGLLLMPKLNARSMTLRRLNNFELEAFFNDYHLDGNARASYGYGLYLDEILVMAASVRTNFKGETEIARLASNYNYIVRGGASRLIKAIKKEVAGPLISFSNNRLSSGALYEGLGFKDVTKTKAPSYYYTDGKERVWRFRCRRINDASVLAAWPGVEHMERAQALAGMFSESLFGDQRPLYKLEDCGHRKWLLA